MTFLALDHVSKSYPSSTTGRGGGHGARLVFSDLLLEVQKGTFVTIIGHSGCGKSTLINLIAGFEHPEAGRVILDGHVVDEPGLDRMVVFQQFALLPWMNVFENIELAVRQAYPEWGREKRKRWTDRYISLMNLSESAQKRPSVLSGGMRQRVGLARAFSVDPKVLLLDEPFAQIDPLTRGAIQAELEWMYYSNRNTVVMVTHDVETAILLSDRIVVMSDGPNARFVADIEIDLPRPRGFDTLIERPEVLEIRRRILQELTSYASIE